MDWRKTILEGLTLSSLAVVMSLAMVSQDPKWSNICFVAVSLTARIVERIFFPRVCRDDLLNEDFKKLADRLGRIEMRLK